MNFIETIHKRLYTLYNSLQDIRVPFCDIVGICAVENSSLNTSAVRFEPGVYDDILLVKHGKHSSAFPGFSSGNIHTIIQMYSIDSKELKSLATSYGFGQIMGYIHAEWGYKPEEYMIQTDMESLIYLMKFYLQLINKAKKANPHNYFDALMRLWNTGSPTGKTYDPNYIKNATNARNLWKATYMISYKV